MTWARAHINKKKRASSECELDSRQSLNYEGKRNAAQLIYEVSGKDANACLSFIHHFMSMRRDQHGEKRERLKHFSLFLHFYLEFFAVWVHENDIPGTPAYGFPYLFLLAVKLIPLVVFLPRTDFPEISLLDVASFSFFAQDERQQRRRQRRMQIHNDGGMNRVWSLCARENLLHRYDLWWWLNAEQQCRFIVLMPLRCLNATFTLVECLTTSLREVFCAMPSYSLWGHSHSLIHEKRLKKAEQLSSHTRDDDGIEREWIYE